LLKLPLALLNVGAWGRLGDRQCGSRHWQTGRTAQQQQA
jgi:hypothetical protein